MPPSAWSRCTWDKYERQHLAAWTSWTLRDQQTHCPGTLFESRRITSLRVGQKPGIRFELQRLQSVENRLLIREYLGQKLVMGGLVVFGLALKRGQLDDPGLISDQVLLQELG